MAGSAGNYTALHTMEWKRRTYRVNEIVPWQFPIEVLQLNVVFSNGREFDFDEEEPEKDDEVMLVDGHTNLAETFVWNTLQRHGEIAHINVTGVYLEVRFFHPYYLFRLLKEKENILPLADEQQPDKLSINLFDSTTHSLLWFAGCPTLNGEEEERNFYQEIKNRLEDRVDLFTFDVFSYDRKRRELLVNPKYTPAHPYEASGTAELRKMEMVNEQSRILSSEIFKWADEDMMFLVRSVNGAFCDEWLDRRDGVKTGMTKLTKLEKKAIEWTDNYLKERLEQKKNERNGRFSCNGSGHPAGKSRRKRNRADVSPLIDDVDSQPSPDGEMLQNRPRSQSADEMEQDLPSLEGSNSPESSLRRDPERPTQMAHDGPAYAHPSLNSSIRVKQWKNDREVKRTLIVDIRRQIKDGTFVRTDPNLSALDYRAIDDRIAELPWAKKANFSQDASENDYVVNGFPFATPSTYELIGKKQDKDGPMPFYDCVRHKNGRRATIPPYRYMSKNFIAIGEDSDAWEARICDQCCSCDSNGGCHPDTCECIQHSDYYKGRVDLNRGNGSVMQCGKNCPCYAKREERTCPSIVQFRRRTIHVVNTEQMGFSVRIMSNLQRGEPLMTFTGELRREVTRAEGYWTMQYMNCETEETREFTGINDVDAAFNIYCEHFGNASRFVAHSQWDNLVPINIYQGGTNSVLGEVMLVGKDNIEAGDFGYYNYGMNYVKAFGIGEGNCGCTQELCHDPIVSTWMRKLGRAQLKSVLILLDKRTKARMFEREEDALNTIKQEDSAANNAFSDIEILEIE